MAVEYLDPANDDGSVFGRNNGKIAFYGNETTITKPSITLSAGTTTTLLKADVYEIANALGNLGLLSASY